MPVSASRRFGSRAQASGSRIWPRLGNDGACHRRHRSHIADSPRRESRLSSLVLGFIIVLVAAGFWWFWLYPKQRRARLAAQDFPAEWEAILRQHWPLYWRLGDDQRRRLHAHIQPFLAEKTFFGCDGFELTEEVRVLIAAQACLLILEKDLSAYDALEAILVYPGAYRLTLRQRDGSGVIHEQRAVRLGESWGSGRVVLSWDDVLAGLAEKSAHNVCLHEFAHQLDQADGVSDGTPILANSAQVARWVQVFTREFERLRLDARYGLPTVIDPYGAENPAEFFAVCSEAYVLHPHRLAAHHPGLYRELSAFYRFDPKAWQTPPMDIA